MFTRTERNERENNLNLTKTERRVKHEMERAIRLEFARLCRESEDMKNFMAVIEKINNAGYSVALNLGNLVEAEIIDDFNN